MPQERTVQPPQIAAWLIGLFITEEQMGELEQTPDKFSDRALRCGSRPARRWYWKQSAKTIAGHIAREFRTAPWLIVGNALGGALLFQFGTGKLQYTILRLLDSFNHHVMPYYDRAGVAGREFWMYHTVLIVSLLESLIVGCLVAGVARQREMIATMSLSFISLVMTATIFWASIFFQHIMIDQLSASLLMIIGGIIVREFRSVATR